MGKVLNVTLLWICVNVMLMLAGFTIGADQGNLVVDFFGENVTGVNNSNLINALPEQVEVAQSDSSSSLFVDNTKTTFTFWSLLKNSLGGSFVSVLVALGVGSELTLLIGIPLSVIAILGLIAFVRGFEL